MNQQELDIDIDASQYNILYEIDAEVELNAEILRQRNQDVYQIAEELEAISEINLRIRQMVNEQGDELQIAEQYIEIAEHETQQATDNIQQSQHISHKLKGWMTKGAIISTGITGVGAITGVFLSPIIGGIGVVAGIGGILFCLKNSK